VANGSKSAVWADLRGVLAGRDFRRLFATRLVSQAGDGIVTAGVGTYVFFNATTFPSPAAGAAAFAVLYLPYSLIGPFAGVLIDRWSRRQILVRSALVRSVFVALTAAAMALGNRGALLYAAVLLVLGVNRFFLSSLSVALPHVVAEDQLVVANAVSPTIGGISATIGGVVALGLNVATGNTERGAAVTLLAGGACYVTASLVAATMPRDRLGPVRPPERPGRPDGRHDGRPDGQPDAPPPRRPLLGEFASVAAGLADGARYVMRRPGPAAALGATGGFSLVFGPLFLMAVLLYRNYFYRSSVSVAEGHFGLLVGLAGVGYACAALLTPPATRRLAKPAWITVLLIASSVVTLALGETFVQVAYLAIGFCLYLTRQGVAICAVTVLQEEVDDAYRGRVFAFYDMMFNAAYVAGAALSVAIMPADGHSPLLIGLVAAGFAVVAAAYWLAAGRGQSPPGSAGGGGTIPSAAAQRNSS
jgi:MFS family permease